jgi:hypothetical protein
MTIEATADDAGNHAGSDGTAISSGGGLGPRNKRLGGIFANNTGLTHSDHGD